MNRFDADLICTRAKLARHYQVEKLYMPICAYIYIGRT